MGDVITTTLQSGEVMVITRSVDTGELILSGLLLAVLTLMVIEFVYRVIYKWA